MIIKGHKKQPWATYLRVHAHDGKVIGRVISVNTETGLATIAKGPKSRMTVNVPYKTLRWASDTPKALKRLWIAQHPELPR